MLTAQTTGNMYLIGVPMIGILFAGFFRLDELIGKTKSREVSRPKLSGWDQTGKVRCSDPDERLPRSASKKSRIVPYGLADSETGEGQAQ